MTSIFNKYDNDKGESGDDLKLSPETFVKLRNTIYRLCGIYYNENKIQLVESRIKKRIEILDFDSFEEYLLLISSINGREELVYLFDAITINETYFFRAEYQFAAVEKIIIPDLIKNNPDKKNIRIWSAATSSGEEAYTLAMLVKNKFNILYPDVNFEIFASDISDKMLKKAKEGIYSEYSVRNLPGELFANYFDKYEDKFKISDDIINMVNFSNFNLYDKHNYDKLENFDIVFCSNVLMYFDLNAKAKVVSNIYNKINDNGFLFIGYAESLHSINKNFTLVHFPKAMAYKK